MPIINITPSNIQNQSDIGHGLAKLGEMPPGIREVEGYKEYWTEDESQAIRVFDIQWSQRYAARDWFLGYTTNLAGPPVLVVGSPLQPNPNGVLHRSLPAAHPEQPWLFASRMELMQGIGAMINNPQVFAQDVFGNFALDNLNQRIVLPMIAYHDTVNDFPGYGRYAVTYSARDYELRSDAEVQLQASGELSRYVSRFWTYSALMLPLGSLTSQLYYGGDLAKAATVIDPKDKKVPPTDKVTLAGQNVPEPGAKIIPMQQLTYKWHQVPDVPEAAIDNCVGHVNGATFDGAPGARAYPPGTLLCHPPQRERTPRSIVGRISWTITYRFDYRAQGWNFFPAADGQYYLAGFYNDRNDAVLGKVPDHLLYEGADFNALFKPPPPVKYQ
ncbi:MAG: hypothetical protein V4597_11670 [Pseudomonadota bacterium]